MKLLMPCYCKDFKCIAEKCSDNCCIGWEIDIDEKTAAFYATVKGDFGEKLRANIEKGECNYFRLKENERCPFLNEKNLCEIILSLGEDRLCDICTRHPRYFQWFYSHTEGGIGLACEEGARLIMTNQRGFSLYEDQIADEGCDEYDEGFFKELNNIRLQLIHLYERKDLSVSDTLKISLSYGKALQYSLDNALPLPDLSDYTPQDCIGPDTLLKILGETEILNSTWEKELSLLTENKEKIKNELESFSEKENISLYLRNIAQYFIWRYFMRGVFDGEVYSYIFLTALSTLSVAAMLLIMGNNEKDYILLAKDFSKQIEYSEENIELIRDYAYKS